MTLWSKLAAVLAIPVSDGPHESPDFIDDGVPFLSVDNITEEGINFTKTRFVSEQEHLRFSRKCRPALGDVLLTKAASVGKVGLVQTTDDFNVWSPIAVLRPEPGSLESRFLAYALRSQPLQDQIFVASTSNTQRNIAMRDISALRIPLPTLNEQRRIADFLDDQVTRIDQVIALRKRQVAYTKLRADSSVYLTVVGGTGMVGHTTDRPWSDCHWQLVPLGRIATKLARRPPKHGGVVTAFRDGFVGPRSMRREEGFTFSDLEQGYQGVNEGDLVFHGLDGFAGAFGVAAASGRCTPVYHVMATPLDDPRFLAYALRVAARSGLLTVQVPSTRQRAVDYRNWSTLASFRIPRPPLGIQHEIADRLDAEVAEGAAFTKLCQRSLDLLQERKRSLITAAVTGEFDVSTASTRAARVAVGGPTNPTST